MPVNKLYYEMKGGKHAVILVSREFADYRIFETEEQARLCVEKLEHLREEQDTLWAKTLFVMYT
jgi:predicted transcriptional regulator